MALKTGKEYIESLQKLKPTVYILGEKVDSPWEHPLVQPSQNAVAMTYDLAFEPQYQDLMTTESALIGGRINRFTHVYQSRDDLVKKIKMLRLLGQRTATCFQRCTTMETFNPLHAVTYEIDQKYGTEYHRRFLEFIKLIQREDLSVGVAMTDVKGDRSKRPTQQADPDLYLHVVEERGDGIIVKGAKAHQTGAINFHWIVALPGRAMREEDREYAIGFAAPTDAEGVIHFYSRQPADNRKLEQWEMDKGNVRFDTQTTLIIFDNVFIPWERVFMYKEYEFCGRLANLFGSHHRHSYGGCKSGVLDVLIGATALMADYHGIADASHIRSKLTEMVVIAETVYACGLSSAYESYKEVSGVLMNDPLLGNTCKLNIARLVFEAAHIAIDICGGIVGTLPAAADFHHPMVGKYLDKYLKGVADIPTEHRFRIIRLIENLILGTNATPLLVESVHGAGSPEAQKAMIERLANLEYKKELAKAIAGIGQP